MGTRQPGMFIAVVTSFVLCAFALETLAPGTAGAAGRLLYWDNCSNGGKIKDFACNTNDGYHDLVAAFWIEPSSGNTTGLSVALEIGGGDRFNNGTLTGGDFDPLPSYWVLDAQGCRAGEGAISIDFGSPPFTTCNNPWGNGSGGPPQVTFTYPFHSSPGATPTLLIEASGTWPEQNILNHVGENYAFRLRVSNARSTGPDACASCCAPMTATVRSMILYRSNGSHIGLPSDSDTVVWNESGSPLCGVTATQRTTWGLIKGLYR